MSHKWILGIDPGTYGALALLAPDGAAHGLDDTPILAYQTTTTVRHKLNVALAAQLLLAKQRLARESGGELVVYLEEVSAMPTDGGIQAFSFGRNFGNWEGVLAALGLRYEPVRPAVWKALLVRKLVSLKRPKDDGDAETRKRLEKAKRDRSKEAKLAAIEAATKRFPVAALALAEKGGNRDGRAEALLIAEYGRMREAAHDRGEPFSAAPKPRVRPRKKPRPAGHQEALPAPEAGGDAAGAAAPGLPAQVDLPEAAAAQAG